MDDNDDARRPFRLVCHTCSHRFPVDTAVSYPECCLKPSLHIHNIERPCRWCDDPTPKEADSSAARVERLTQEKDRT